MSQDLNGQEAAAVLGAGGVGVGVPAEGAASPEPGARVELATGATLLSLESGLHSLSSCCFKVCKVIMTVANFM